MNRRDFIRTSTLGAAMVSVNAHRANAEASTDHPNILWLISEDTSPDLACYGTPGVQTPNLDKLASQGTRYTNAFVTAPVCSAARSAFMTGMYQTAIGAHNHRSHRKDDYRLPAPVKVVTEYFRQAGYFTCNGRGPDCKRPGKTDWNFKVGNPPFDGTDWTGRKPGQPFFAQVNFGLTHRTFQRDPENPIDPAKVEVPPYYPDHPVTRRDWADYLESIQVLDRQIGEVLQRLEDEGLADNTVVFYFGDHGRPHVRGKQWLYDGGIRIPLIIRWPGHIQPKSVGDDLVSAIDFAPTCLSLAGVDPPQYLQGQSFIGPNAKPRQAVYAARDRCDETVDRIRCVCTKRFKYIRNFYPDHPYTQFNAYKKHQYPVLSLMQVLQKQGKLTPEQARFMTPTRPEEELYDLQTDPDEVHNLCNNKDFLQTLHQLRTKLNTWMDETSDVGAIPEDESVLAHWQNEAVERFKRNMAEKGLTPETSPETYLEWWEKTLGV